MGIPKANVSGNVLDWNNNLQSSKAVHIGITNGDIECLGNDREVMGAGMALTTESAELLVNHQGSDGDNW
jgi:hypothetical protein